MPKYGIDTEGTSHGNGRDTDFTHKSIGYDTTRYLVHFEVLVHHRKWNGHVNELKFDFHSAPYHFFKYVKSPFLH